MNHKQRTDFIQKEFKKILELSSTKGVEYANSNENANANFYEIASKLGIDAKTVLWVYATKHQQAIASYIKNKETLSEPIEGRIHDLILYLFILLSMIEDDTKIPKIRPGGLIEFGEGDIEKASKMLTENGYGGLAELLKPIR